MKQISKLLFVNFLLFVSLNLDAQDDQCDACFNTAQFQMNNAAGELNDDVQGCSDDLLDDPNFWLDMIEGYTSTGPSGSLMGAWGASSSMYAALNCISEAQSDYGTALDNAGNMLCACCPYTC